MTIVLPDLIYAYMNVYDYFFRKSGFLHKRFLLRNIEELTYEQLQQESLKLARYIRETYGQNQQHHSGQSQFKFLPDCLSGHLKIGECLCSTESMLQKRIDIDLHRRYLPL